MGRELRRSAECGFERFDEFISDQHHLHVGERLCEASTCSCEMEGYVEKCELSF